MIAVMLYCREPAIQEMKCLLTNKLKHVADCLTNNRVHNLYSELDELNDMAHRLSDIVPIRECVCLVQQAIGLLIGAQNEQTCPPTSFQAPVMRSGCRGRPAYDIPVDAIQFFVQNFFKVKDIAAVFGTSERTIKRRMSEQGISIANSYSNLSDEELQGRVHSIIEEYPDAGYRSVIGHLLSQGCRVHQQRVINTMRKLDPVGMLFRGLYMRYNRIHRRCYSVRAPQAIWHIDGNHKLIRFVWKKYISLLNY